MRITHTRKGVFLYRYYILFWFELFFVFLFNHFLLWFVFVLVFFCLLPASRVPNVIRLFGLAISNFPFVRFSPMFIWTVEDSGCFENMLKPYTSVLEIYRILNICYSNQCNLNAIDKGDYAKYHLINIKTNK